MSVLSLKYDVDLDRVTARMGGASDVRTTEVIRDKVTFRIDATHKSVVAFEVADFRHFVNYHILAELFGDDVVRSIAAFQSSAVAEATPLARTIEVQKAPRVKVIEELLRAA